MDSNCSSAQKSCAPSNDRGDRFQDLIAKTQFGKKRGFHDPDVMEDSDPKEYEYEHI